MGEWFVPAQKTGVKDKSRPPIFDPQFLGIFGFMEIDNRRETRIGQVCRHYSCLSHTFMGIKKSLTQKRRVT
jgi:hypothetical protein